MGRAKSGLKKRRGKADDGEEHDDPDDEEEDEDEEVDEDEGDEEEEANEPVIVELGDTQAVKTALDDSLVQVVGERGFSEDYNLSNVKILLGMLASSFGLFGQFHEYGGFFPKFPDDRHILGICVLGYMCCSSLLSLLAVIWEKNYIGMATGPPEKELAFPPLKDGEELPAWCTAIHGIKVETRMGRFDTDYTAEFTIQTADGVWQPPENETQSICKWFNVEGLFLEDVFQNWGKDALQKCAKRACKK